MKHISLLFLIISLNCASQNYEVVYNLEQVAKNINLTTNIKTYLKGDSTNSIYVEDFRNAFQESSISFMNIPIENNPTYYKNLLQNAVTYSDHIRFKFFNILDDNLEFNWNIESETKEILGYNCQKATLHFRGRDFTVFFTVSIAISNGPYKFSGLPGLILEVISDDSVASFHYLVQSIDLSPLAKEIKNIYSNKEIITYQEFVQNYNKKYQESLTKIINEQGEKRPMSKGFMEVMVK